MSNEHSPPAAGEDAVPGVLEDEVQGASAKRKITKQKVSTAVQLRSLKIWEKKQRLYR